MGGEGSRRENVGVREGQSDIGREREREMERDGGRKEEAMRE
jgi:hypothetical protein